MKSEGKCVFGIVFLYESGESRLATSTCHCNPVSKICILTVLLLRGYFVGYQKFLERTRAETMRFLLHLCAIFILKWSLFLGKEHTQLSHLVCWWEKCVGNAELCQKSQSILFESSTFDSELNSQRADISQNLPASICVLFLLGCNMKINGLDVLYTTDIPQVSYFHHKDSLRGLFHKGTNTIYESF